MAVECMQLPVRRNNPMQTGMVAVDHTTEGPPEPPRLSVYRLLRSGLGKFLWGIACCLVGPLQFVVRCLNFATSRFSAFRLRLPLLLQTPAETLPRLLFRMLVGPISDHFMGSYLNMYYSPQCVEP